MRYSSEKVVALAALAGLCAAAPCASAQQPGADARSPAEAAARIHSARRQFSPELERIKALAGRWEGTTHREREKTNPAVVTYSVTGAGSAVIETLFPGTVREMTTV